MTDDTRLSLFSAGSSSRTYSIRSSATSATTLSNSEFSFGYSHSDASSGLTTPIDPTFTRSPSPASSTYFKPLPPSAIVATEIANKPLPPPPPPANDSDLLELILALQSVNRSMKILNSSLGSLSEDMTAIETMLITRELLVQELKGQPGGGDHDEREHNGERFAGSRKYLRNLYQKYATTSPPYTP